MIDQNVAIMLGLIAFASLLVMWAARDAGRLGASLLARMFMSIGAMGFLVSAGCLLILWARAT